jgi:hypothetical protein
MSSREPGSLVCMKTTTMLLAILSLALAVACEKKEEAPPSNEPVVSAKPGEAPATAAPADPAMPAVAAAGEAIGVAECDAYVTKYSECLAKVPADQKLALQKSFDDQRAAWKTSAATPEGKAGLAASCQTAIDTAKTATSAFGCQF